MKKLFENLNLYRLKRRGEAVANDPAFWNLIDSLTTDLLPGKTNEIPRDLFRILAFWWAVTAQKGVEYEPYDSLLFIREKAWLGYTNMPEMLKCVRTDFSASPSRERILNYFDELAEKQSTYLFLPVVSSIDRHQASATEPPLLVDDIMPRIGSGTVGSLVQQAFLLAPGATRQRAVFLLALTTQNWGRKQMVQTSAAELSKLAATQLRLLYDDPEAALAAVQKDAGTTKLAKYLADAGREIATETGRPLLLETLYIAENWITGPQHFAHAFEIREKAAGSSV